MWAKDCENILNFQYVYNVHVYKGVNKTWKEWVTWDEPALQY